jgi:glutamine cyclotransferase
VVESFPQDPAAFTQGLCYDGATLYLGTGLYGSSSIRHVDLATGLTLRRKDLGRQLFGEGIALHGALLYQLTWQAGQVLTYDAKTLQPGATMRYQGEGWGLTSNGRELIMSNGSEVLCGRDPKTFAPLWHLRVTRNGLPVSALNELEYIKGRIYANVWKANEIVVINPKSGTVEAVLDCSGLMAAVQKRVRRAGVLNGIAYDARRDLVLVTGKNWDRVVTVRVGK